VYVKKWTLEVAGWVPVVAGVVVPLPLEDVVEAVEEPVEALEDVVPAADEAPLTIELPVVVEALEPLAVPVVAVTTGGSLRLLNGFLALKTLRCELATELASSETVGSLPAPFA
jgi:hypothetical protein